MVGVGNQTLFSTMTRVFDSKLRMKRGLQKLSAWSTAAAPGVPPPHSAVAEEYFRLLKLKERWALCTRPAGHACGFGRPGGARWAVHARTAGRERPALLPRPPPHPHPYLHPRRLLATLLPGMTTGRWPIRQCWTA